MAQAVTKEMTNIVADTVSRLDAADGVGCVPEAAPVAGEAATALPPGLPSGLMIAELDETEVLRRELELVRGRAAALEMELARSERDRLDLDIALTTAIEHGDAIENVLDQANRRLTLEVEERRSAELRLEKLLNAVSQQNQDLELLIHTITEHSDNIDVEWMKMFSRVEEELHLDGLTRIGNRRAFDVALDRQWHRALRYKVPISLVMADIDFFKQYNDAYGHQRGDECLAKVGEILSLSCRRPDDLPARYGGEEFAVILPETDMAGAQLVAETIVARMSNLSFPHRTSPFGVLTVSIGIATLIPASGGSVAGLIELADSRLYAAKRSGRNRIVFK